MLVARELGLTLGEALQKIPYSEFLLWCELLDEEQKRKWEKGSDPLHMYLARLCHIVDNMFTEHPREFSKYLIGDDTAESIERRKKGNVQHHKSILCGMFGIDPNTGERFKK